MPTAVESPWRGIAGLASAPADFAGAKSKLSETNQGIPAGLHQAMASALTQFNNQRSITHTSCDAVTLERGVMQDSNFGQWAGQVRTKQPAEVVKHREGGDPSTAYKSLGRTKYDAITLERGVTQDSNFGQWADQIRTKQTTEVVEHRQGGDPSTTHKSPGRTKYEDIPLERG